MKNYLTSFLEYNSEANKKFLAVLKNIPDNTECVRLFSHIINTQNKWLNRIESKKNDNDLSWIEPSYPPDELEARWNESITGWFKLINYLDDHSIEKNIVFKKPDGKLMQVKIKDIIFQLNCHSIHHRAQIAMIIRKQGINPPVADYIFTAIKEVESQTA